MAYVLNLDTSSPTNIYGPAISTRSPVRVVATTNINLALNLVGVIIDGVTLAAGDRVLLTAQTTPADRGIYVIVSGAGATTRSRDFELGADVTALIYVNEGTVNARTIWWARYDGISSAVFNRYLFPDTQGDVSVNTADTLTNKTITDNSNTLTARGLRTATTTVAVNGAAPPNTGQYLVASSSTTANWQTINPGGEINTASSIGGGTSIFKQKTGVDFEFNSLNTADAKLTSTIDANDNIVISVNEGAIEFSDLWSATPISVAQGGLGITTGTTNGLLRANGAIFAMDLVINPGFAIMGTTDVQNITLAMSGTSNNIVADAFRLALNSTTKVFRNSPAPTAGQVLSEITNNILTWETPTRIITFHDFFEDLNAATTTSSTFVILRTYTTPVLPSAGNYLITWCFPVVCSVGTSGTFNVDIQIDGVGGYSDCRFTNSTGVTFLSNSYPMMGIVRVNLTATAHTIVIRGNITGGNTLSILTTTIDIMNI